MNNTTNPSDRLDPAKLLASTAHRLTLHARLTPTAERDRFQPAGFPEVGHVIYDSPRGDGSTRKVCIVDSVASMANHLETVCHQSHFGLDLHPDLNGLPHVQCVTDDDKGGRTRLVVTTLSEGHRLASSLFTDAKSKIEAPEAIKGKNLNEVLLHDEFKLENLGKRTHPLPADWWNVFRAVFKFDPNSLVHGILFPAMGIKIPRALTAQLDAFGAARVASSGVKFDKLLMTTSGQPIFAKDEETAQEIRATFVIDLALIRSFGRGTDGLTDPQKQFLVAFSLWKIAQLLQHPFRFRSGCDLEFVDLVIDGDSENPVKSLPKIDIKDYIKNAGFAENHDHRITKVYWKKDEIFKVARDAKKTDEKEGGDQAADETASNDDDSNDQED